MAEWGAWYEKLGEAIVDGGNPFGPSMSVSSDGSATEGAKGGLTGYTILSADSLSVAADQAKGCPVLASGGDVEVYEALEM